MSFGATVSQRAPKKIYIFSLIFVKLFPVSNIKKQHDVHKKYGFKHLLMSC